MRLTLVSATLILFAAPLLLTACGAYPQQPQAQATEFCMGYDAGFRDKYSEIISERGQRFFYIPSECERWVSPATWETGTYQDGYLRGEQSGARVARGGFR